MQSLAFWGNLDVTQVLLYLFWIFFAVLVFYLQRESQREGYPIEEDSRPGKFRAKSLFFYPPAKTFKMPHGGVRTAPNGLADTRAVPGKPIARFPGAPLAPTGTNPMLDSIGPGSWAERSDTPDLTIDGRNKIVPLRAAEGYALSARDQDPRGLEVRGCDFKSGGKVVDVWVDRSECLIRYIEVAVPNGKTTRNVLLPMTFAVIKSKPGRVMVEALTGAQLAHVPGTAKPDSVTLLEEDKICAYYGAGTLYALKNRQEPLL
jgi:photosynthetic reaction center H subunit